MAGFKVLLVEDEMLTRIMLAEALRDLGWVVIDAASGDTAAALLEVEDAFDLLLTDVHLPGGVDGIELAKRARYRNPTIPVVIVTGYNDIDSHLPEFDPLPIVVRKPYSPVEVAETAKKVLRGSSS